MKRVGYLGAEGSFSEMAAKEIADMMLFGNAKLVPMTSAKNVLNALLDDEISYGVVAIRNTTAGAVSEFVEAFGDTSYDVQGMCTLPIHHCLFKKAGTDTDKLTTVASHPQALAQTKENRQKNYSGLTEQEVEDTALAAQMLAEGNLSDTTAVICSKAAGEKWNLELIEENIEDSEDNQTIFWMLTV